MKIDTEKLEIAQAKCGKDLNKLGIPIETLRNVKRGKNVRPSTVYKLAQALGCDVEDIIRKED